MKKVLFTLLSLLLFSAVAQAATNYGFYVAGTMVTSDNCNNIVNNYIKSGRVSYDPGTNTLFMYNVTINTQGASGDARRAIQNNECSDLIVMFRGTCNLTGYDGAGVRIRKSTTLLAPEATDVVNIHSVNAEGIWMATSNNFDLYIQGPGTFNISSDTKTALEDEDDGSGIQLDVWHEVYFYGVNAVLSSGGNSVMKRVLPRFIEGSSVRFKATNNSSYPVINYCGWQVYGNETLLEPYGAYHDGSYVCDANGNRVYDKDVYVSDDYVAIINSTNFPNANFRNYLLGLYPKGYITQTDVNNRTYMDISGKSISNIYGIQYFTELKTLYANDNLLNMVDLTSNKKLENLYMQDNRLAELKLTGLTQLKTLNVSRNWIINTDSGTGGCLPGLSTCTSLQTFYCNENSSLTTFNASDMSALKTIDCRNNPSLTTMKCFRDNLTTLYVNGNTALTDLRCFENADLPKIIGLADCTAITYLDCEDCAINDLSGVNSMSHIATLLARNNKLTTLDVSQSLYLNTLRVSGNTLLTNLKCYGCDLTNLYVTGCSSLTYLDCTYNKLTSLDVTGCSALNHLEIYFNKISGTGMTTLVNSLPTRSASNKGVMYAIHINDNNSMTAAQITTASNKYWLPKKYNGSAWVDLTASTRGDVDGDGSVNISDVTALIDYLLSGNASGINVSAADCDQDNSVNISDVTSLIDYLLSGSW